VSRREIRGNIRGVARYVSQDNWDERSRGEPEPEAGTRWSATTELIEREHAGRCKLGFMVEQSLQRSARVVGARRRHAFRVSEIMSVFYIYVCWLCPLLSERLESCFIWGGGG